VLIGQLQDEVDFLQTGRVPAKETGCEGVNFRSLSSKPDKGDFGSHEDKKMKMFPDLNLAMESPIEEVIKEET
jgi:hypothetical protein